MSSITDVSSGLLCCPMCDTPSVVVTRKISEICLKCINALIKEKEKDNGRSNTKDNK